MDDPHLDGAAMTRDEVVAWLRGELVVAEGRVAGLRDALRIVTGKTAAGKTVELHAHQCPQCGQDWRHGEVVAVGRGDRTCRGRDVLVCGACEPQVSVPSPDRSLEPGPTAGSGRIRPSRATERPVGTTRPPVGERVIDRAVAVLRRLGRPATPNTIARELGHGVDATSACLGGAARAGRYVRVVTRGSRGHPGLYALLEEAAGIDGSIPIIDCDKPTVVTETLAAKPSLRPPLPAGAEQVADHHVKQVLTGGWECMRCGERQRGKYQFKTTLCL